MIDVKFPLIVRLGAKCIFLFLALFSQSLFCNNLSTTLLPPPPDTFQISLVLECGDDSLRLCTNLNGLVGTLNSSNICSTPVNGSLTIENDTCFFYHPVPGFNGADSTCIVVCDNLSNCDTFFFEIFVEDCNQQNPCADIPYDLLTVAVDDCNDLAKVCNPFPLGEALLYNYSINGLPYSGNLGVCAFDTLYSYNYGSLPDGGQSGPYELKSWVIDGEIYSGLFENVQDLVDLMNMLDLNGKWQIDNVTSNLISFNTSSDYGQMTIVQVASNDIAILSKNSTTAPIGSTIYLPTGEYEVSLQHQLFDYCVDSFTAVVYCNKSKIIFDTLAINETKSICADPMNLPGTLQSVEAKCFSCQSISIEQNGDCVKYTGIAEGTDSLMVSACDQYGICDSTLQIVTVRDENQLPVARIDKDTTDENVSLELDILQNDIINGDLKNIFIIIYPQNGLVNITTDFRMTYHPDKDYCGIDAFAYEICNENGCDTSTATILVRCKRPFVYDGFSPNDDGKNEHFKVFNIEDHPENQLYVYNRWGNLVYQKKGYKNEWTGNGLDNQILPDGTYFYVFEIKGQIPIKGFVQIQR